MIKLGQKVQFDPYHSVSSGFFNTKLENCVTGTVVLIHPTHRWFMAEYEMGNQKFRTSFKFDDLGGEHQNVFIVKE